jgi:hemolysin activation/secretion protein
LLSGASSLTLPASALAQVQAPTREEVTRPAPPPVQPPRSQLEVEGGIERAPCALDNPQFRDIRFTLRGVEFDGLSEMAPEALAGSYAALVGREHPVSIICEVRDRAATMLRQAGYIASVEVPEQRIADGTVRFRVLMARLVDVRIRGDAGGAERPLANYLGKLKQQPVFNRFEAERYLLLANDLPGYNVRLTLRWRSPCSASEFSMKSRTRASSSH